MVFIYVLPAVLFANIISGEMINFTNRLTELLVHC